MKKEEKNTNKCPVCGRPTHKGSKYCIFHASSEEKTEKEFKKALREYVDKIKEEDCDYDFNEFIFIGEIDFKEDLNVTVFKNANFWEATFEEETSFEEVTFEGGVSVNKATFKSYVTFGQANFKGNADFWKTKFERNVTFGDATFRGSTRFDSATFELDADFRQADFKLVVGLKIVVTFRQTNFKGYTYFEQATFEGRASFDRATFKGNASFDRATFEKNTDFCKATFKHEANFKLANFKKSVDFWRVTFGDSANFKEAIFKDFADFEQATFRENADLEKVTFEGRARFDNATFEGIANFDSANFQGKAGFGGVTFKGGSSFEKTSFGEFAYFVEAIFELDAQFKEATFKKFADFKQVIFKKDAYFGLKYLFEILDFTEIKIFPGKKLSIKINNEGVNIFFRRAYLENMDLEMELAKDTLIEFTSALIKNAKIKKDQIENHILQEKEKKFNEAKEIYLLIKNNFHSIGKYEDESWAFTKEKEMERISHSFFNYKETLKEEGKIEKFPILKWIKKGYFKKWVISAFSNKIYGYGEKPWNVIFSAGAIILFFALFFSLIGIGNPEIIELKGTVIHQNSGDIVDLVSKGLLKNNVIRNFPDSLYFSLITFTTLGYGDFRPLEGWGRILAGSEAFIGAFMMALFVYTFARRTGGR